MSSVRPLHLSLLSRLIFWIILALGLLPALAGAAAVTDYQPIFTACLHDGKPSAAIRRFTLDGTPSFLIVDPYSFRSIVAPANSVKLIVSRENEVAETPYGRALQRYTSPPVPLQNAGIVRMEGKSERVVITIDLCPSRRSFERALFNELARMAPQPVPISLSVTKGWMDKHGEELDEILRLVAAGKLRVTWVNHSATHPYYPRVPLSQNFLLSPGTDFVQEVLSNEEALLSRGLVPSPFFRFPGLVADKGLMEKLHALSLVPVGSNAWLAKGEMPKGGSFILVHGNGNEPRGVELLLPLLRKGLSIAPIEEAFDKIPLK